MNCGRNFYITTGLCAVSKGWGVIWCWGLLNLSISGGKVATWARQAQPVDVFLMSGSSPCSAGAFNELRPASQAVCMRVELLINH